MKVMRKWVGAQILLWQLPGLLGLHSSGNNVMLTQGENSLVITFTALETNLPIVKQYCIAPCSVS